MRRRAPLLALAAGTVAVIAVIGTSGSGTHDHKVRAEFDYAFGVFPGLPVRLAGRPVGEVVATRPIDGHAVVTLRIDDDAWPLHHGTQLRVRTGPVATYASGWLELDPGPRSQPLLPDGGVLANGAAISPVEFDDVNRIFTQAARGDTRRFIGNLAAAVSGHEVALAKALRDAPHGFDQSAGFLRELGANETALRTLAVAGARASGALAQRRPQLQKLISTAALTFDELARHEQATRGSLERFAPTLAVTRSALQRVDRSLTGLNALVTDVRPGAAELRRTAPSVLSAVTALREVAPTATNTLRSGSDAVPSLRGLLQQGAPFAEQLRTVLHMAKPIMGCIRPYAPELASLVSTWASFSAEYDANGNYARALLTALPFGAGEKRTSKQVVDDSSGTVGYGFPTPPGSIASQPWYQPQCGAGPSGLDPAHDPEAGP